MKKTPEQEKRECMSDISRANRAQELLNNPLYLEAVTAIEASMFLEFQDSKLKDEDSRHELWQRMQLLKQFKGRFESIVKQGEKAKTTLTLLEKAKKVVGF
jgi:hypothetical protein